MELQLSAVTWGLLAAAAMALAVWSTQSSNIATLATNVMHQDTSSLTQGQLQTAKPLPLLHGTFTVAARTNLPQRPSAMHSKQLPLNGVSTETNVDQPSMSFGLPLLVLVAAAVSAAQVVKRWARSKDESWESLVILATHGEGHGHGHGHGHGAATAINPNSFVQTAMRTAAMKLHTRDQSKEGEQKAQKPISQWTPSRQQLLQFLVDSRVVHAALDQAVLLRPELAGLQNTGLERVPRLDVDIATMLQEDPSLTMPEPSPVVSQYAEQLVTMAKEDTPAFVCHFYNTHFAHTAGGQMIGRLLSNKLLDGRPMEFYKWDGDVQVLLSKVRDTIDSIADGWSEEEKTRCVEETAAAFRGGAAVIQALKD